MKILEKLSFGFEIEGIFKGGMYKALDFKGRFVSDGSVGSLLPEWPAQIIPLNIDCENCTRDLDGMIREYCVDHHANYHREGSISTEYASAIFQELPECLNVLKKFNKKNHTWNRTCGLHFHVGMKNNKWQQLWAIASNKTYLEQLSKEAQGWCDCQKERLQKTANYCLPYQNSRELVKAAQSNGTKYRFVNFHRTYHTLEFRFLSPCEHKVSNVTKLLNSLTAYLGRDEKVHKYSVAETEKAQPFKMEYTIPLHNESPINLVKRLFPGRQAAIERGAYVGRYPELLSYVIDPDGRDVIVNRTDASRAYELEVGQYRRRTVSRTIRGAFYS